MYENLFQNLKKDVRFIEGLNACMNCGICTAICPAAEFFEYDPRSIVTIVQSGNEEKITNLIESDTIWYCGQCMSCKTRCPRNNCPGMLISVLRKVSQETGAFVKSKMGRKQYLIKNSIGKNILKYGYSIHPSSVIPENHPEQGTVWEWIYNNKSEAYQAVGANLDGDGPGALRKIPDQALFELRKIFELTGGDELFKAIENFSNEKAAELGFTDNNQHIAMKRYSEFIEKE